MHTRRQILAAAGAVGLSMALQGWCADAKLTPLEKAREIVDAHRPLRGAAIPADIAGRLGATHYSGHYHLTDQPFLLEGCQKLREFGFGAAKFWFAPHLPGYAFNSDWKLPENATLTDVAKHAYFVRAFEFPFTAFALEIQEVGKYAGGPRSRTADFTEDRRQFRELTAHLLKTYRDRDVRFILQHWEGDWMVRQRPGQSWEKPEDRPRDIDDRLDSMVRWLSARQAGVEEARRDAGATRCKVEHAMEVNRVFDGLAGVPTLTTHVLPRLKLDWVSWSSYDANEDPAKLYQGIELIRKHAGDARVYIGEIGLPESERDAKKVADFWDGAIGAMLAQKVPLMLHWQLYCNERRKNAAANEEPMKRQRGFWLVRPDGSLSISGEYLKRVIAAADGRL